MAHVERGHKLLAIADYLGMHYASISRIVVQVEQEMLKYNGLLPKWLLTFTYSHPVALPQRLFQPRLNRFIS